MSAHAGIACRAPDPTHRVPTLPTAESEAVRRSAAAARGCQARLGFLECARMSSWISMSNWARYGRPLRPTGFAMRCVAPSPQLNASPSSSERRTSSLPLAGRTRFLARVHVAPGNPVAEAASCVGTAILSLSSCSSPRSVWHRSCSSEFRASNVPLRWLASCVSPPGAPAHAGLRVASSKLWNEQTCDRSAVQVTCLDRICRGPT